MSAKVDEQESKASGQTGDPRVRHYVERVSPLGVVPPVYSRTALCGERVSELTPQHGENICQACIDESRRRPVERAS